MTSNDTAAELERERDALALVLWQAAELAGHDTGDDLTPAAAVAVMGWAPFTKAMADELFTEHHAHAATVAELTAERDALVSSLDSATEAMDGANATMQRLNDGLALVAAERDALAKRLREYDRYVEHSWECAINDSVQGADECTCGLSALLNAEHQT